MALHRRQLSCKAGILDLVVSVFPERRLHIVHICDHYFDECLFVNDKRAMSKLVHFLGLLRAVSGTSSTSEESPVAAANKETRFTSKESLMDCKVHYANSKRKVFLNQKSEHL